VSISESPVPVGSIHGSSDHGVNYPCSRDCGVTQPPKYLLPECCVSASGRVFFEARVESVKELIHVCFDIWLDLSFSLSSMMILLNMCYHLWHVGYVSESVFCLNAFPNYPVGDGAFSDIPFG